MDQENSKQQEGIKGEKDETPKADNLKQLFLEELLKKDLEELQKLELVHKLGVREEQARQDIARIEESLLQAHKFRFEAYKTKATLGSAAIVAYAVAATNLADEPIGLINLLLAYVYTVLSVVFSMINMSYGIGISHMRATSGDTKRGQKGGMTLVRILDLGSSLLFGSGLLLFLFFVHDNLY
jgi:hypothetical protein